MVPSPPVSLLLLAYYRGAIGILLVYDVTDESSFNNIRNWIRNIEQHTSNDVNKILVGNKADMDESKRAVATSKGQALADEYDIKFFETDRVPGHRLRDLNTCLHYIPYIHKQANGGCIAFCFYTSVL